jgi:hypothetical protein
MADIQVKDLFDRNIAGSELFNDSENFMVELSDDSEQIVGGMAPKTTVCTIKTDCDKFSGCIPTHN